MVVFRGQRRYVAESLYQLLFSNNKRNCFFLACQELGLDEKEYLELKRRISYYGGELMRVNNKDFDLGKLKGLFAGTTLWVLFPSKPSLAKYKELKSSLESYSCVVLFIIHQNQLHYEEHFLSVSELGEKKKQYCLKRLVDRKNAGLFVKKWWVKKWFDLKRYADITSVKKES